MIAITLRNLDIAKLSTMPAGASFSNLEGKMITARTLLVVRTVVAVLGLAAISTTTAEAGDFTFEYNKYVPSSVRSRIEAYVGKIDGSGRHARAPAKPKAVADATVVKTAPTNPVNRQGQFKSADYAVASAPTVAPPAPPVASPDAAPSADGVGL